MGKNNHGKPSSPPANNGDCLAPSTQLQSDLHAVVMRNGKVRFSAELRKMAAAIGIIDVQVNKMKLACGITAKIIKADNSEVVVGRCRDAIEEKVWFGCVGTS